MMIFNLLIIYKKLKLKGKIKIFINEIVIL